METCNKCGTQFYDVEDLVNHEKDCTGTNQIKPNPMKPNLPSVGDISLARAREILFDGYEDGSRCLLCNQYVKLYKRKLTSAMAYALILLDKKNRREPNRWVHMEDYLKSLPGIPSSIRGDFAKLRFWGLIVQQQGEREDKSDRVGMYKITEKGIDFVHNRIKVSKQVFIYNNDVKGFSPGEINIRESLGQKFRYDELMNMEAGPHGNK